MNYLNFFVQAAHSGHSAQRAQRAQAQPYIALKSGGINKSNYKKKVTIIRMGNSRSRLRFGGGDPTEYILHIANIRELFNSSDMIKIGIKPRSTLQYMAQTFILGEKLLDKDPGSLAQNLMGKVTKGDTPTNNQQTAIAYAKEWDAAVQTAKQNWSSLPTKLRQDPNILKYCHDISPGGPDRYLAKLQECFNADAVAVALDSEFGIPGAVPYLTRIWWYRNAEQLPMMPFTTTLLKLRESQPDAVMTANRQSILKLATDWDVSMGAIAAKSGKLMPEMAAAWDAARSATAAVLRDLNRQNRSLKLFALPALGNGAMVVPGLNLSSDCVPFGSVCADMRSVAQSARHWRLLNPEFMFTVGGSANGARANGAQRDVLGKVTSICAFSDSETGEPSVLVGSTNGRSGRIIRITGNGTVVGRSPDSNFLMQGIGVLQDGRCIVSNSCKDPLTGQTQRITGMASKWDQPFTLHAERPQIPCSDKDDIVILNNPGSDPICVIKTFKSDNIECYQVSADRQSLSLTPLAYEFLPPSCSQTPRGMCRIPASCQCMCGKSACMQDRLAFVDLQRSIKINDAGQRVVDYRHILYILSPVGELLHEKDIELEDWPVKVAFADQRNEIVFLCACEIGPSEGTDYSLFACSIDNADDSEPLAPRKLVIDTEFMRFSRVQYTSIAIIDSMLFIAGWDTYVGAQLNGYRY